MFEVLDNIYIDRFLLLAFVKYNLSQIYSHFIRNCTTFRYLLAIAEKNFFLKKILSKVSYIYVFYPKPINFHNLGIVTNALLIGLQYTLPIK